MKFDLETPMSMIDGTPMVQGGENSPATLRNLLHMAISSNAIFTEEGPAQGSPRPLTQAEHAQRMIILQKMVGNELSVTAEHAAQIKDIARQGLPPALALPLCALIDTGGSA